METIIRQVRNIEMHERRVLEKIVGRPLLEDQEVIIQVITSGSQSVEGPHGQAALQTGKLPEWCNVYEGLTNKQIEEVDEVILQRTDLTRPSE